MFEYCLEKNGKEEKCKNHNLQNVYRMSWTCDRCTKVYRNQRSNYCVYCSYNECMTCAGKTGKPTGNIFFFQTLKDILFYL